MRSIGNDIIALAETDKDRTSRYRFYSRILSPGELSLYDRLAGLPFPLDRPAGAGLSFSTFVWLLWSIKESVYKYVSRSDPRLVFSPLKIPVSGLTMRKDYYEGTISYGGQFLFSRSFLRDEVIMSIAGGGGDFSLIRWGVREISGSDYATQSAGVRKFALGSLSTVFPGAALRIVKAPDGPPEIRDGGRSLDIPISLAHHGRYVAWSYRLPENSSLYRKSAANYKPSERSCIALVPFN
ncbi:MAG TPA: 4'-phosphopantetheinyl transferase superfamily protein [Puia sp.]|nr:4'-phosphopantetheinyl transferase superfamily protein [Puia sp.]